MNPLYVGIDVSSKTNVTYLMRPDGSKYSSFSVQNNVGGAKILSEKIVSAMNTLKLTDVVIGMEATSKMYPENWTRRSFVFIKNGHAPFAASPKSGHKYLPYIPEKWTRF